MRAAASKEIRMLLLIGVRAAWTKARMSFIPVLVVAAQSLSPAAAANEWTFVWVGATAQGWTVIHGTAVPRVGQEELHFDLTGANSVKYTVDAQLKKDGTAEAGLAGLGDAYVGITILRGKFVKKSMGSGCKVEVLQVQNDFNSLSIGKFNEPGCKQ
jgi:hypothetical protein